MTGNGVEASSEKKGSQDALEVEVERLDDQAEGADGASRWGRAIGPVLSGLIIDVLDLATLGGVGMSLGFLLGTPAGWYLARNLGLDRRRALYVALACGVYCAIPVTSPVPIATLLGVWVRARQPA